MECRVHPKFWNNLDTQSSETHYATSKPVSRNGKFSRAVGLTSAVAEISCRNSQALKMH
jgi:hypothetical protein